MDHLPTKQGKIPFHVPSVSEPCFTFFKVFGELSNDVIPLIVVHGGPGAGHEYLLTFAALWPEYSIPVIFYDQIGCASSTHLQSKAGDESFWRENLFIQELDNLIDYFELRDETGTGFHLLGQSWGGMLCASYAGRRPQGLRRLILASALASMDLNIRGIKLLCEQLPPEMQATLKKAEKTRNFDNPEFNAVSTEYSKRHVFRSGPPPAELLASLKNVQEDNTVYRTMRGPSTLFVEGSLLEWTSIPGLPNIGVPTLVYNGENDTSHDVGTTPFFELIPRVRWVTLAGAGHMCHLEGGGLRDKVLRLVGQFLVNARSSVAEDNAAYDNSKF